MFSVITKYDKENNPIMTSLFLNGEFKIAYSGWYNKDNMVKLYMERIKQ